MNKLLRFYIKMCLLTLVPSGATVAADYITPKTSNNSCLHLRRGRSSRSGSRGCFSNGTSMRILRRRGNWIQVKTGSATGWVYNKYTRSHESNSNFNNRPKYEQPASIKRFSQPKKMFTNATKLHVRKGPGTNNTSIGFLKQNSKLKAIGKSKDGKWIAIERNGQIFWVHGNYAQNKPFKLGGEDQPVAAAEPIDEPGSPSSAIGNILALRGIHLSTPICGCRTKKCRRTGKMGMRRHPISRRRKFHGGTDIGGGYGKTIVASAAGVIKRAGRAGGYGNAVYINHGKGIYTRYGHMKKVFVRRGQRVKSGQKIGLMGSTGHSTGPHLHFEVRINGKAVNSEKYVNVSRGMLGKSCNRKSNNERPVRLSLARQQLGGTR